MKVWSKILRIPSTRCTSIVSSVFAAVFGFFFFQNKRYVRDLIDFKKHMLAGESRCCLDDVDIELLHLI